MNEKAPAHRGGTEALLIEARSRSVSAESFDLQPFIEPVGLILLRVLDQLVERLKEPRP